MADHFKEALDAFLVWFTSNGGYIHPSLTLSYEADRGICARRSQDTEYPLKLGDAILRSPHALSLSSLNALGYLDQHGFPLDLPEKLLKDGNPRLAGAVFLCVQYLLSEKSFWYPYLNVLPKPYGKFARHGIGHVESPMYWSKDELSWLQCTNLERGIIDLNDSWEMLWKEWGTTFGGWTLTMGLPTIDWDLFKWALTIFGTRSFSPSVLRDMVHDRSSKPLLEVHNPHSLLYPGIDLLNHGPRTANRWTYTASHFDIVLNEIPKIGDEIFNTYGCQSNAQLMLSWGFCLEDNPFDSYALQLLSNAHEPLIKMVDDAQQSTTKVQDELEETEAQQLKTSTVSRHPPSHEKVSAKNLAPPCVDQTEFMAFELANSLFMVRDPKDVGDDEEYSPSEEPGLAHLRGFPEMLLSRLAAQVANDREREAVQHHPGKFSSTILYRQLGSRNLLQLGELLKEKLDLTRQVLEQTLSKPSVQNLTPIGKKRLQQAQMYRDGQTHILYTNTRMLAQYIEDAQTETRAPLQLYSLTDVLTCLHTKDPAVFDEFVSGFGDLGHDIKQCVLIMEEQGSEDILMIATLAAIKHFGTAARKDLGMIFDVLEWYIKCPSTKPNSENYADLAADVQQYVTNMREAIPGSRLWSHESWNDHSFLTACARYVMEETVTLAPHATGAQLLCAGPMAIGYSYDAPRHSDS